LLGKFLGIVPGLEGDFFSVNLQKKRATNAIRNKRIR
ncbi:unnamed protein product, partial [marine sediment metagenome]